MNVTQKIEAFLLIHMVGKITKLMMAKTPERLLLDVLVFYLLLKAT